MSKEEDGKEESKEPDYDDNSELEGEQEENETGEVTTNQTS
jgi:hypothetical protein